MSDGIFINVKMVAAKLGVHPAWVYKRVKSGKLPFYRRGDRILFRIDEIEQLMYSRVLD